MFLIVSKNYSIITEKITKSNIPDFIEIEKYLIIDNKENHLNLGILNSLKLVYCIIGKNNNKPIQLNPLQIFEY
jgi:hypothetical protein